MRLRRLGLALACFSFYPKCDNRLAPEPTPPVVETPTADSKSETWGFSADELVPYEELLRQIDSENRDELFTDEEMAILRELQIAVFRRRVILNAEPPITPGDLALFDGWGKIAPELIALGGTASGGQLDYSLEVEFGEFAWQARPSEFFTPHGDPRADHFELVDAEARRRHEIPEAELGPDGEQFQLVPFAGHSHWERFYAIPRSGERGGVLAFFKGFPATWNQGPTDRAGRVADSVNEFFDRLALFANPFTANLDEYDHGYELAKRIAEIEPDHTELAAKLRSVVRESVIDWRVELEKIDFSESLSLRERSVLRRALHHAVASEDTEMIVDLDNSSAPMDIAISGRWGILSEALSQNKHSIVDLLLEHRIDGGPVRSVSDRPLELVQRLLEHRVIFEEDAIYGAARKGAMASAIAIAKSGQLVDRKPAEQIATEAIQRAEELESFAADIAANETGIGEEVAGYRLEAKAYRRLAEQLSPLGNNAEGRN